MANSEDFLDEIIAERTKRNPDFPRLVEEALLRRRAARAGGEDPNAAPPTDAVDKTSALPPETADMPD